MASTLDLVRGKWKPMLLYHLTPGPRRFGELQRLLGGQVTQHTLTQQLRELEHDGLVYRQVFAEVPPRVEYSLTDKGRSLRSLMDSIYSWGEQQNARD
ncbi:winged helix-turn-helix transcriptional regulator [Hymenobacter terrenus]|uniref:winged helix-turn-helix transcriptional regulator n=1 Tax=Hymenobacter terrenus TaxID=1629124 RepID=UPI00061966CB|nr:helix-turn-helix domain-containing protein [Hymenobacter terrenus]